ncbi:MAG: hypothetical protein ACI4XI_05520 [Ruminococcus sp.]
MCNKVEDEHCENKDLYFLLKEGLDCITPLSGIPAKEVFEKIEKEYGFQCCSE